MEREISARPYLTRRCFVAGAAVAIVSVLLPGCRRRRGPECEERRVTIWRDGRVVRSDLSAEETDHIVALATDTVSGVHGVLLMLATVEERREMRREKLAVEVCFGERRTFRLPDPWVDEEDYPEFSGSGVLIVLEGDMMGREGSARFAMLDPGGPYGVYISRVGIEELRLAVKDVIERE